MGSTLRTVANLTEGAGPAERAAPPDSNIEAVLACALAVLGVALPVLFPFALILGRKAVRKASAGAEHRGLAAIGYSIGWIGTAFWVALILLLAVGTVFSL